MNWLAWLFWIGLLATLYVIAGYPLLLAWIARRRPRPVRKAPLITTVSVIIPVRNGAAWLAAKLDSILDQDYPQDQIEILVLSDGSTDATGQVAESYRPRGIRFIRLEGIGKSAALTQAFPLVTGEILLLTDVRQPLSRDCLRQLVDCFSDPEVGVASGELIIRSGGASEEANTGLYWKYETWIRKNLALIDSMLGATGPIYAIRRSLAVPLPAGTLLDDVYLPMQALQRGYRLVMEEAAKAYDFPTALASEFRRKVRTQAGIYQLFWISPWVFTPQNRVWFYFVSQKLGRLFLPFFLLMMLIGSFGLSGWWSLAALAGQALFYGLASLDPLIPEGFPLKRLSAPIRAFVVLVIAALYAITILFREPTSMWKETRVSPTHP